MNKKISHKNKFITGTQEPKFTPLFFFDRKFTPLKNFLVANFN
jgi:hypothetical protein